MVRDLALIAASLALLCPAEAFGGASVARAPRVSLASRSRSAFVAMSDEAPSAVADAPTDELEVSNDEARSLSKTHLNKRKRPERTVTVDLAELSVGSVVEGVVKNVVSYGAFVDIGAAKDGMLHVSDISNSFVANITDVLSVGDKISARVKSVDSAAGRFALIMKDENAEPATPRPPRSSARTPRGKPDLSALADFDKTKMMKGKVVSVMDFGCFVSIGDNTDGLVHISQLQDTRTESVSDVVKVGDEVDVRIIGIDMERQRVSLSMLPYSEESEAAASSTFGGSDTGAPAPRRDPAARSGQQQRSTAPAGEQGQRKPRRDRDDTGPPFPSTSSFAGERAVLDGDEDAPTLFQHAWISAQHAAAAKGMALPADMAE